MIIFTFCELLLKLEAPAGNRLFQKDYLNSSFYGVEVNATVSLTNRFVKNFHKYENNDAEKAIVKAGLH